MSIRIPANIVIPRRTLMKGTASAALAAGVSGYVLDMAAQHGHDAGTPASDSGTYTSPGTGDATPGPIEPTPFKRYSPYLSDIPQGQTSAEIVCSDATVEVAKGKNYAGWTFNGTIPGAPIRARVGETLRLIIRNEAPMTHSVDTHSAQVAANKGYPDVQPGESFEWDLELTYPGAYMTHCGTPPVLMHIATGMYLPLIVDPPKGEEFSPAMEIILSQSEFYLKDAGNGTFVTDTENLFQNQTAPTHVCFNGHASQYVDEPIRVPAGRPVRVYFVNHGPNHWSAFHIVGAIFHKAYLNANPKNVMEGLQTITVGPGDGCCVETVFPEPGTYVAVNHSFGFAQAGAMAKFIAE